MDRLLWDPKGPPNSHGWQVTPVDQAVNGHLGYAHYLRDFRHGKEADLREGSLVRRGHEPPTIPRGLDPGFPTGPNNTLKWRKASGQWGCWGRGARLRLSHSP